MKAFGPLVLLVAASVCSAQSASAPPAAAKSASCKVNAVPLTPAQVEFEQNEYKTAADHFVTEIAAHPENATLKNWQVRNLLAKGDVVEGTGKAEAWLAEKPDLSLALTTKAETQLRNGLLAEAYATAAKAQKLDPCNGRVYFVLSEYEHMISMHATEKRHIDLAHALEPKDAEITSAWIFSRPREQSLQEWRKFVDTSDSFTDKQRTRAKERLARYGDKPHVPECKLTSGTKEATIPFSAIRFSPDSPPAYGLELSFNGKKRRLELDTGASGLTLTAAAAERLGLVTEETALIGGVGDEGPRKSRVTHVAKLKVGEMEFSNCAVYILPPRNMDYAGEFGAPVAMDDIDGLVGGDIFEQFLLTLDYPGGELKVSALPPRPGDHETDISLETNGSADGKSLTATDEPPKDRIRAPEMQDWTQFYRIDHYILIPTQLNDGPIKLLMADTGASMNIVDPAAARLVTKVSTTNRVSMVGISGETKNNYLTDKIMLHFGKLYLPLPWMVAIPMNRTSNNAGVEISGFLGFPALRQMTLQIDYRDSLIHFAYDPKRPVNAKFRGSALDQY